MSGAQELRDALVEKIAIRIREQASSASEAVALRVDRWVEIATGALRELGKASGLEVAPIRRGVGDLGWELVWGRNLIPDYTRLGATKPEEIFRLELVAEIAEASIRPGVRPESAVEEVCFDLGRLMWARAPFKVLVFGARRESEPANSIEALEAGLASLIQARDQDSSYVLVALPNLEGSGTVAPEKAILWTKVFERGKGEPARTQKLFE
ncbi:MAG TPA: hypothetical protein VFF73_31945 [Planctomycetota bacterium]|nr:hypothetical protein [Planctomycetota bacterium]